VTYLRNANFTTQQLLAVDNVTPVSTSADPFFFHDSTDSLRFLLQTGTPITEADAANFTLAVGDYNRDGIPDVYCFKRTNTGTGTLEVHVLNV
jgi:hypothetical protein